MVREWEEASGEALLTSLWPFPFLSSTSIRRALRDEAERLRHCSSVRMIQLIAMERRVVKGEGRPPARIEVVEHYRMRSHLTARTLAE